VIYWIYFKAVAGHNANLYVGAMKLAEIEQEALALPERERAALVAKLLDTLPPPGTNVTDEEVEERERELDSGQVAAISHEEFVRRVRNERGG
jgi:putative addiction module component (TIGR02574 family)